MAGKRSELIAMGVNARIASRGGGSFVVKTKAGATCRDRLPWGGFTEPDRCDCVGQCQYDKEKRDA